MTPDIPKVSNTREFSYQCNEFSECCNVKEVKYPKIKRLFNFEVTQRFRIVQESIHLT